MFESTIESTTSRGNPLITYCKNFNSFDRTVAVVLVLIVVVCVCAKPNKMSEFCYKKASSFQWTFSGSPKSGILETPDPS